MKKNARKTYRNVFYETIIFILFMLIIFTMIISPNKENFNSEEYHTEKYIVKSEDTLWTIGRDCISDNADVRDWIKAVEIINNITSNIYPGQSIIVYVYNG